MKLPKSNPGSNYWRKYFQSLGLQDDLIEIYIEYVERMLRAGLPIVFEFNHLAMLLGRTPEYLASAINCPVKHYRVFNIPKRKGGSREISAPYPALLECQQWINNNILAKIKPHSSAQGFIKNKSIINNAKPHLSQSCLLKVDIKDFFPTISFRRVMKIFQNLGYPQNISFYLSSLCCLNGALPQGAATSPSLSNIVLRRLDKRLSGISKKSELNYTRYADDMTFSGKQISGSFLKLIEKIINEEGFAVNNEKTRLSRGNGKKIVTGLSVHGDELTIPNPYKREIKQEVYYILKYGLFSHLSKKKIKDPFYIDSLLGKLAFWKWVEPDNAFANNAIFELKKVVSSL